MEDTLTQERISAEATLAWLTTKFAEWLEVDPATIDPARPVAAYGLDSISAVTLSVDLEDELGIELQSALLWDYPTLGGLAAFLAEEMARQGVASLPDARGA